MKLFGFKLLDYHGRMNRKPYFLGDVVFCFTYTLITKLLIFFGEVYYSDFLDLLITGLLLLSWLMFVIFISFWAARRLHDLNYSGWYQLLGLVPIINIILGLFMLFKRGTQGPNDYGPDPLE